MATLQDEEAKRSQLPFSANDPRWLLANRITQSSELVRSERLSRLLLFVCRMHLEGRDDEINEQRIGTEVFRRPPSFDSGSDTIVRTHATRLRQKLENFFKQEGHTESLHLEIPRGGYVPRFFPRDSPTVESTPVPSNSLVTDTIPLQPDTTPPGKQGGSITSLLAAFFGGIIASLTLLAVLVHSSKTAEWLTTTNSVSQTAIEKRFWEDFFSDGSRTLVVTGDSGLVLYETFAHREIALPDYIAGKYALLGDRGPGDAALLKDLPTRRYTSVTDLNLVVRLSHLPQWEKQRADVIFARDLRPADAAKSNLILIGSRVANPWVSIVENSMNFILTQDESGSYYFLNRNPQNGEQTRYSPSQPGGGTTDSSVYALICYRPENQGMRKVVLLSGLWQSGTEAAGSYVLGDRQFGQFLARIAKSDGIIPGFELLVRVHSVAGNAFESRIVASRVK